MILLTLCLWMIPISYNTLQSIALHQIVHMSQCIIDIWLTSKMDDVQIGIFVLCNREGSEIIQQYSALLINQTQPTMIKGDTIIRTNMCDLVGPKWCFIQTGGSLVLAELSFHPGGVLLGITNVLKTLQVLLNECILG